MCERCATAACPVRGCPQRMFGTSSSDHFVQISNVTWKERKSRVSDSLEDAVYRVRLRLHFSLTPHYGQIVCSVLKRWAVECGLWSVRFVRSFCRRPAACPPSRRVSLGIKSGAPVLPRAKRCGTSQPRGKLEPRASLPLQHYCVAAVATGLTALRCCAQVARSWGVCVLYLASAVHKYCMIPVLPFILTDILGV